jgi:5-dehydro-4-deoxyglucarate dehydratase
MPAYAPLGFTAYSSAISNYIPHISRMFYDALLTGRKELLNELYRYTILPISRLRRTRKGYAVSLIKAGMELVGLPVGTTVRPPLIPVEPEHYRELERILAETFRRFPKPERADGSEAAASDKTATRNRVGTAEASHRSATSADNAGGAR